MLPHYALGANVITVRSLLALIVAVILVEVPDGSFKVAPPAVVTPATADRISDNTS